MIKRYQSMANAGIGVGFVASLVGRVLVATQMPAAGQPAASPAVIIVALLLVYGGVGVFIWGCVMYALGKNRHGAWGAFGLLWLIGLIVLVFLRDDAPDGRPRVQRGFDVMPTNGPTTPPFPPRT